MYAVSPLRYPGAKWRLESFVHSVLVRNDLIGCSYVEPFAGGASLAISLLLRGYVSEIHLNDLDRSIFAFWHSVVNETNSLVDLIEKTPVNMDVWFEQKEIQNKKENANLLELGFSTFYLNRTNRSGIIGAGVIGGKEQNGQWKIDARFNKGDLISRILKIASFKDRIKIYNYDALFFLKREAAKLSMKSFTYLDPPYYVKGRGLYLNFYKHEEHEKLCAHVVNSLSIPWMISYDDVKEIRDIFEKLDSHPEQYLLPYSASLTRKGKEVFYMSSLLEIDAERLLSA